MKPAPAVSVLLQPSPGWQYGIGLLAGITPLSVLAWILWHGVAGSPYFLTPQALPLSLATTAAAVVLGLAVWRLRVSPLRRLSWDGQQWWGDLRPDTPPNRRPPLPDAALPGEVTLQIDLGGWMLLRFVPLSAEGQPLRHGACWAALGEAQHSLHWHALRCALCNPRTVPLTPST